MSVLCLLMPLLLLTGNSPGDAPADYRVSPYRVHHPGLVELPQSGEHPTSPPELPALSPSAAAVLEDDRWSDAFHTPGPNGQVNVLVEFEGRIIAGGGFTSAGASFANHIAAWDGESWERLGGGFNNWVTALVVYKNTLIAGGDFTAADGSLMQRLAWWDGAAWKPLGGGVTGTPDGVGSPYVTGLTVHEGSLYVAGRFTHAGNGPAAHVARWDGENFHPVGSGFDDAAFTLLSHDGALYAGGIFTTADTRHALNVARWDGASWSPLGDGVDGPVLALHAQDNTVFAGGLFNATGNTVLNRVAAWNGTAWSPVGNGLGAAVWSLVTRDGRLTAGGFFLGSMAEFDGQDWIREDPGADGPVFTLLDEDQGLFAGGLFATVDGVRLENAAQRTNGTWHALPEDGGQGFNNVVWDAVVWHEDLYVTGDFTRIGRRDVPYLARWNGGNWETVGDGINGPGRSLGTYRDELIVSGLFGQVGDLPASAIASWNGTLWSPLGAGLNLPAKDMAVLGSNLIVGGWFFQDGAGRSLERIASWNGVLWRDLDGGVWGLRGSFAVNALATYQNRLYVGGQFDLAGGEEISNFAVWTGIKWEHAAEVNSVITALTVFNGELVVSGGFTSIDGKDIPKLARFDGDSWRAMGEPLNDAVSAFTEQDGELIAGGRFLRVGDERMPHIARWNGTAWETMGLGLAGFGNQTAVYALATLGHDVFAGGLFDRAGGKPSQFVAQWDNDPTPVKLTHFTADRRETGAVIRWGTPDAGARFRLERGNRAQVVATHLTGRRDYEVIDAGVPPGPVRYLLHAIDRRGAETVHGPLVLAEAAPRPRVAVSPNPFSVSTAVHLVNPRAGAVRARVFDLRGREIRTVLDDTLPAGERTTGWDGRDALGRPAPAGVYFLRIDTPEGSVTAKLVRTP